MTHSDSGHDAVDARDYREIERSIGRHPGYTAYRECEVLRRSLAYVFGPNWRELLALLEQASTDEELSFELVQNVHEPATREQFHGVLTRHLHNYVASAKSLVDHVRCIMKTRSGEVMTEFENRKAELLRHPEVPFVHDLRNFMLHRTLPFFAHSLTLHNINTPQQTMVSEVELNVCDLQKWTGWTAPSKRFLAESGEQLLLRPVVQKHGDLVYWFNRWVHKTLMAANEEALEEVNQLVVQRNAAWGDVDLETARRMTDEGVGDWLG